MQLSSAYNFKDLAVAAKAEGLDLSEDALVKVLGLACDFLEQSAKISASPIDDVAVVLLPMVKKAALGAIDKIDGQDDGLAK